MNNIVITGGSSGLGLYLCDRLLYEKYREFLGRLSIYSCGRRETHCFNSRKEFNYISVDLTTQYGIDTFISSLPNSIDILVLNAAITGIHDVDGRPYTKDEIYTINVKSNIDILNACLPKIKSQGKIVFISSSLIEVAMISEDIKPYVAMKLEVEKYLSETIPDSISLCIVRPGIIGTNIHRNSLDSKSSLRERHNKAKDGGLVYKPQQIVYLVALWIFGGILFSERVHTVKPEEADILLKRQNSVSTGAIGLPIITFDLKSKSDVTIMFCYGVFLLLILMITFIVII